MSGPQAPSHGPGTPGPWPTSQTRGSRRTNEYAAALDRLAKELADGAISQGQHDVRRQILLAEARQGAWPRQLRFLIIYATVWAILSTIAAVLWLLGRVIDAFTC